MARRNGLMTVTTDGKGNIKLSVHKTGDIAEQVLYFTISQTRAIQENLEQAIFKAELEQDDKTAKKYDYWMKHGSLVGFDHPHKDTTAEGVG